jgi:hypothetical protein
MCSISASFNLTTLKQLIAQNAYRGSLTHSIAHFEPGYMHTFNIESGAGPPRDIKNLYAKHFYIVHQQAPTGNDSNVSMSTIHPSIMAGTYLWHNGLLKENTVKELKKKLYAASNWDTSLIHTLLKRTGKSELINVLGELDGSFACLYFDNTVMELYAFRNELAPLYYDHKLNFSSTRFEGAISVPAGKMFRVDFKLQTLVEEFSFETKSMPYDLQEEELNRFTEYDPYEKDRVSPNALKQALLDGKTFGAAGNDPAKKVQKALKFNEEAYLKELTEYIYNTYGEHYAGKIQSFEKMISDGHADGFAMGSIGKYASRYGKKEGYKRDDILKIAHYAILMLHQHDTQNRGK